MIHFTATVSCYTYKELTNLKKNTIFFGKIHGRQIKLHGNSIKTIFKGTQKAWIPVFRNIFRPNGARDTVALVFFRKPK